MKYKSGQIVRENLWSG